MRITVLENGIVVNFIEADSLETALRFYPECRLWQATDVIAQGPTDPDTEARWLFDADEFQAREKRFQRDKNMAGVVRVSRFQLRLAALRDSPALLATLDQSVADSTDRSFKLRWDEHGDFSRVMLNNTTLTVPQKNALFAAALLE